MLVGLVIGVRKYLSIEADAVSAIHQVYAVATAGMWFVGAYILARAVETFGKSAPGPNPPAKWKLAAVGVVALLRMV